jgi:hypothetical protein
MKFALTLIMDTRVVESPFARAAVKSAHMAALKARFMLKKKARTRMSIGLLVGERERRVAMWAEREEVRDVVVLVSHLLEAYIHRWFS